MEARQHHQPKKHNKNTIMIKSFPVLKTTEKIEWKIFFESATDSVGYRAHKPSRSINDQVPVKSYIYHKGSFSKII
jgi:hypothetical protein